MDASAASACAYAISASAASACAYAISASAASACAYAISASAASACAYAISASAASACAYAISASAASACICAACTSAVCACEVCAAGRGEHVLPAPPEARYIGTAMLRHPYPEPDSTDPSTDDYSSDSNPWDSDRPWPFPEREYVGSFVGSGTTDDPMMYEFQVGKGDDPAHTTFNPEHIRQMAQTLAVAAVMTAMSQAPPPPMDMRRKATAEAICNISPVIFHL
ncbi:PREDICTED: uncharacterized protein LOC106819882 [Priapulus caudatus]|uniref:Uncharacterized protein LOC106819882 n=1 Tax=Priapulus caudatus TaxID=37621 RepID=A0ABM1F676_PRICU|nr:PREDICTED: uncharacterized protein LOC106819882 [Priapulus caudatus]